MAQRGTVPAGEAADCESERFRKQRITPLKGPGGAAPHQSRSHGMQCLCSCPCSRGRQSCAAARLDSHGRKRNKTSLAVLPSSPPGRRRSPMVAAATLFPRSTLHRKEGGRAWPRPFVAAADHRARPGKQPLPHNTSPPAAGLPPRRSAAARPARPRAATPPNAGAPPPNAATVRPSQHLAVARGGVPKGSAHAHRLQGLCQAPAQATLLWGPCARRWDASRQGCKRAARAYRGVRVA